MGLDGLFRPSQMMGYTDTIGHLGAADRALEKALQANLVEGKEQVERVGTNPEEEQKRGKKKRRQPLAQKAEHEDELTALLRREFKLELDPDIIYRFNYNSRDDLIELMDTANATVILRLSPDTFIEITESIKKNAGIMTDYSA